MYEDEYEEESEFNPCPNCGGKLKVREMNLVYCQDCGEYIGWYIATAGAIRLNEKWAHDA
ncbi:MAG: hypothetical protein IJG36_10945 [Synergistaceae bacterium]|nr:hypothetical protein [Synergistaceae bacterium]